MASDNAPSGKLVELGQCTLTIQTLDEGEPADVGLGKPRPEWGLYVCGVLGNQQVQLLIDSGASVSILSSRLFRSLEPGIFKLGGEGGDRLATADGSFCEVEGNLMLNVVLGREHFELEFVVANITDEAILGMPALCKMGCVLDFEKNQLICKGARIQCFDQKRNPFVGKVVVCRTTRVPPRCEYFVSSRLNKAEEVSVGDFYVDPADSLLEKSGIVLAKSVIRPSEKCFVVRVCNPLEEEIVLYEGLTVGFLVPVEVLDNDENSEVFEETNRVLRATCEPKGEQILPEHLDELYEKASEGLHEKDSVLVKEMLCKYQDVFSKDDKDLGRTSLVQHHIETGDAKPIKQAPRRLPPYHRREVERQVLDLLERGLIEPSDSAWASPVVMVKKGDGSLRLCIDLRRVNEASSGSGIPLPNTAELLASLAGSVWFSTLDMLSGYWQVELDRESRPKTAFATHLGLHQWRVMPFGLSGAPGSFQKLMQIVLGSMSYNQLLVYLDDVIVPAKTVQEGVERLSEVFKRFREANLKLKPTKCTLFQRKVAFLGHVVSSDGVATDPAKVETVEKWPTPTNRSDVRSFLGLASYYRKYIAGFAHIAYPLNRLTDKKSEFRWTEQCQEAFDQLKGLLTRAPILAHPNDDGQFLLDTDASGVGIGGVLSQVQDGKERVVAYSSKSLNTAERNYCVTRKELWAVVYHVKHFRCYLYGRHFTIRTDHGSLRWLHRFKEPEGQLARWLDVLAEYDYTIVCRPGVQHRNADALSRRPCSGKGCVCATLEGKVQVSVGVQTVDEQARVCVMKGARGVSDLEDSVEVQEVSLWDTEDMKKAQMEDAAVGPVYKFLLGSEPKPSWDMVSHLSQETKTLLTSWNRLSLKEGLLYYHWVGEGSAEEDRFKLVLPEKYRSVVLEQLHDAKTAAHLGANKVYQKVKVRFYWPGMSQYVRWWIASCQTCQKFKDPGRPARGKLHQYVLGVPFERIAMDIVGPLPQTDRGNVYILVICDYFTKYVEAFALPDQQADTVAIAFIEGWVTRLGVPRELHTDQGSNFESELFREMCKLLGIYKTRTTPRNPKSDGLVERQNKTLEKLLGMMVAENQFDWDEQIPYVLMAYRSSVQESTQQTPNMMCFGREVSLPLDVATPPCPEEMELKVPDFVLKTQARLREAHEQGRLALQKAAVRQKRGYMTRFFQHSYKVKDVVWYFCPQNRKGKTPKFAAKWTGPFVVVKVISDILYGVQLNKQSPLKVVHHDHLKPCMSREQVDVGWVDELELTVPKEAVTKEPATKPERPHRQRKQPERYGEWYTKS